jgi:hypothetical protein
MVLIMVSRLEVADGAHCAGLDSLQLPLSVDEAQPLSEKHRKTLIRIVQYFLHGLCCNYSPSAWSVAENLITD